MEITITDNTTGHEDNHLIVLLKKNFEQSILTTHLMQPAVHNDVQRPPQPFYLECIGRIPKDTSRLTTISIGLS